MSVRIGTCARTIAVHMYNIIGQVSKGCSRGASPQPPLCQQWFGTRRRKQLNWVNGVTKIVLGICRVVVVVVGVIPVVAVWLVIHTHSYAIKFYYPPKA